MELLIYIPLINIIAFLAFGIDKWKAMHDKYRISEKTLIGLAVVGGSVGAIAGMFVFHHKTKHTLFRVGLPLILIVQLAIIVAIEFM